MGGLDKFLDMMKLKDVDDDEFMEDDFFDEEPVKPSFKKKEKVVEEDIDTRSYNDYTEPVRKSRSKATKKQSNLVPLSNNRGNEVYVIKPQEFNEAQTVTDFLKEGKTIVINMEGIEVYSAQRIVDFIGGACYALEGTLQAISSNIFIAAPNSTEVSGDLREEILNDSVLSPDLNKF